MGYRKLSARPHHHAQDDDAIPTIKNFPAQVTALRGTSIVLWWQDEAWVGKKNRITSRNSALGTNGPAYGIGHIYGAICPAEGKGRGARTAAMQHIGNDPPSGGTSVSICSMSRCIISTLAEVCAAMSIEFRVRGEDEPGGFRRSRASAALA